MLALSAGCIVAMTGCGGDPPTALDVRQARALAADPLLDAEPRGMRLGEVFNRTGHDTRLAYQVFSTARRSGPVIGSPREAMRDLVAAAVAAGWTITSIDCPGSGYLASGEKLIDGFRANLDLSVVDLDGRPSAAIELFVPAAADSPPETALNGSNESLDASCLSSTP
jgi:hypothetical protein